MYSFFVILSKFATLSFVCFLVHSSFHLSLCSLTPVSVSEFDCLFVRSFMCSCVQVSSRAFVRTFVHALFVRSCAHSFVPFTGASIRSPLKSERLFHCISLATSDNNNSYSLLISQISTSGPRALWWLAVTSLIVFLYFWVNWQMIYLSVVKRSICWSFAVLRFVLFAPGIIHVFFCSSYGVIIYKSIPSYTICTFINNWIIG